MPTDLVLRVESFDSPLRWRWVLVEPRGGFLADHDVTLDPHDTEYGGFVDLPRWLRANAAGEDRDGSILSLAHRVGDWIGREVLGPIGPAILARGTPAVVRVEVPDAASVLHHRPLELGHADGAPIALQRVSFVFEPRATAGPRRPVGERLRVLAVFSLPDAEGPLALRRECRELGRLIDRIRQTRGRAIDLTMLQYGVTRERLGAVLEEGEGWDVIHISSHGTAGRLVLEEPTGAADRVDGKELVSLLRPAKERLKLVVLSACESAAAADELPSSIAQRIVREIGCAALAMRFPVSDGIALDLVSRLYERLFDRGKALPEALQMAIADVHRSGARRGLDAIAPATPALFGALARDLSLVAPPASTSIAAAPPGLAHLPIKSDHFVGRAGVMVRAVEALAPASHYRGVLFHGLPGMGKTTCASELARCYEHSGFRHFIWYEAPGDTGDGSDALAGLARSLEMHVPTLQIGHVFEDEGTLEHHLPQVTRVLAHAAIFLAIDRLDALLTPEGDWRDRRWGAVVTALLDHSGFSRLIATSRIVPINLGPRGDRMRVERIGPLSSGEDFLLARERPNLGALLRGDIATITPAEGRALVRWVLRAADRHPKLLDFAERMARAPEALRARLAPLREDIDDSRAAREALFAGDGDAAEARVFLEELEAWTRRAVAPPTAP